MNEATVKRAITASVRETIALCRRTPQAGWGMMEATAREFSEQLIGPAASSWAKAEFEEGLKQGRTFAEPPICKGGTP